MLDPSGKNSVIDPLVAALTSHQNANARMLVSTNRVAAIRRVGDQGDDQTDERRQEHEEGISGPETTLPDPDDQHEAEEQSRSDPFSRRRLDAGSSGQPGQSLAGQERPRRVLVLDAALVRQQLALSVKPCRNIVEGGGIRPPKLFGGHRSSLGDGGSLRHRLALISDAP